MGGGGAVKAEPSQYEYELGDIATQKYEYEKNGLRPLTDVLINRTKAQQDPWRFTRAAGQGASSALAQVSSQAQQGTRAMLADPGLSPASGSFIAKQGAIGTGTALARSSAAADATFQQGNKYVEGLQNISRIGTKQAELAQSGMAAAAKQMTAQNQNEAQMKMQEQAADAQATGTYAAAGATVAVVAIAAIA